MTNKLISLMTLLCLLGLQWLLINFPGTFNPVELFLSTDRGVAIMRAVLIVAAVVISFWPHLRNVYVKRSLTVFGASLILGGIFGLYLFNGFISSYLKPLDMLLMVELGIIFSMSALVAEQSAVQKKAHTSPKALPAAKKHSPQYILN